MQINIESIHIGLSYPQHLEVVRSLAIIQQQLLSTKNTVVIEREYQKILTLCKKVYSFDSEPIIRLKAWKNKRFNKKFFELRAALAVEFDAVSDEDFFREGNIHYHIESRYLNEEEFNASNRTLN